MRNIRDQEQSQTSPIVVIDNQSFWVTQAQFQRQSYSLRHVEVFADQKSSVIGGPAGWIAYVCICNFAFVRPNNTYSVCVSLGP